MELKHLVLYSVLGVADLRPLLKQVSSKLVHLWIRFTDEISDGTVFIHIRSGNRAKCASKHRNDTLRR